MSEAGSLLLLDRVWPPFRDWIRGLIIAAVAVGSFGLFQLANCCAAPSDLCAVGDAECASSDSARLSAGLVGLALAVVLFAAAASLGGIRHPGIGCCSWCRPGGRCRHLGGVLSRVGSRMLRGRLHRRAGSSGVGLALSSNLPEPAISRHQREVDLLAAGPRRGPAASSGTTSLVRAQSLMAVASTSTSTSGSNR